MPHMSLTFVIFTDNALISVFISIKEYRACINCMILYALESTIILYPSTMDTVYHILATDNHTASSMQCGWWFSHTVLVRSLTLYRN